MSSTTEAHVALENLSKQFAGAHRSAVNNVSLEIAHGETLVLVGPSGCGKTTTLRVIAGFEMPTSGRVLLSGEDITEVMPEKRNFGFMFQHYALFPNMTVWDNIAFGLKMRKASKETIRKRVQPLLDLLEIGELRERYPRQLSGGQQQRVAFARALAIEPDVLLLDEPLTALDAKLRETLRLELAKWLRELKVTAVYVTHDQAEAMSLGDRIAVMNNGELLQCDTPRNIYRAPAHPFVADFIGRTYLIPGQLTSRNGKRVLDLGFAVIPFHRDIDSDLPTAGFATGATTPPAAEGRSTGDHAPATSSEGRKVVAVFRPEDIYLAPSSEEAEFFGEVLMTTYLGANQRVTIKVSENREIAVDLDGVRRIEPGDRLPLKMHNERVLIREAEEWEAK